MRFVTLKKPTQFAIETVCPGSRFFNVLFMVLRVAGAVPLARLPVESCLRTAKETDDGGKGFALFLVLNVNERDPGDREDDLLVLLIVPVAECEERFKVRETASP